MMLSMLSIEVKLFGPRLDSTVRTSRKERTGILIIKGALWGNDTYSIVDCSGSRAVDNEYSYLFDMHAREIIKS